MLWINSLLLLYIGNKIGDCGAESISVALQASRSLKSLDISRAYFLCTRFHTAGNSIGDSGIASISIALQSNTSLTSLVVSCVLLCSYVYHIQKITKLAILVLRAFQEHFRPTIHSNIFVFVVCCLFKQLSHTTDNAIREFGAESISRALQANTSLTSLDISRMLRANIIYTNNR